MSPADLAQIDFSADADRALAALTDDEFEAHFALLVRASRALEARVIAAVNHARHRRIWRTDGLRTTADWVAHKLGAPRGEAAQLVRIGAACERLPALAAVVLDGELGTQRAFVVAKHATPDSIDEMLDSSNRHDSFGGLVQGVKVIAAGDPSRRVDTPDPGDGRGTAGDPDLSVLPPPPHHRPSELRTTEEPDGRIVVLADLTPDDGHLLLTQLQRATDADPTPNAEAAAPWRCRLAASLLHLVCGGTAPPAELVVHLHDLGPGIDPYAETSHGKHLDHHLLERLRCNPADSIRAGCAPAPDRAWPARHDRHRTRAPRRTRLAHSRVACPRPASMPLSRLHQHTVAPHAPSRPLGRWWTHRCRQPRHPVQLPPWPGTRRPMARIRHRRPTRNPPSERFAVDACAPAASPAAGTATQRSRVHQHRPQPRPPGKTARSGHNIAGCHPAEVQASQVP